MPLLRKGAHTPNLGSATITYYLALEVAMDLDKDLEKNQRFLRETEHEIRLTNNKIISIFIIRVIFFILKKSSIK